MRLYHKNLGYALWVCTAAMLLHCQTVQRLGGSFDSPLNNGDVVRVLSIIKGDELLVEHDATHFRVRLLGVEAIVQNTEHHNNDAEMFLQQYVNQLLHIYVESPAQDPHERYLAYMHVGDVDIAYEMVKQGLLPVYTEFKFSRERNYLRTEQQTRAAHRGMWQYEPALMYVKGLRKQWQLARHARGEVPPNDPLLSYFLHFKVAG